MLLLKRLLQSLAARIPLYLRGGAALLIRIQHRDALEDAALSAGTRFETLSQGAEHGPQPTAGSPVPASTSCYQVSAYCRRLTLGFCCGTCFNIPTCIRRPICAWSAEGLS